MVFHICKVKKQTVNFFKISLQCQRELKQSEALDFLQQLDRETEDEDTKIFIKTPENVGYISGEDDASEEGGIPVNVCTSQLQSNFEIIFIGRQCLGS